ncbi:hypothetical protein PLESTB_001790200 [Pleodorina starrii]|uniref:Uncharacterized protein n=1 Tax=Pleodorina starrii TaxID=330485 RepID=A0A9W6BZV6_9CHLO|nr:hypothetical protein PLESTM_001760700 [Pleodorina starrii]GLC61676.1 hypothetical protein PLESTB_001790200 [Pleodorina starrii]GLC76502.1 hypothetical protein PLESTF_001789700 [Pleodorina starrii]
MFNSKRARTASERPADDVVFRNEQPQSSETGPSNAASFQSLPLTLQQRIMVEAARGARGAYASCKGLRQAFSSALRCTDMLGRYCLSAWGRHHAVSEALTVAPDIFSSLPDDECERKLRGLLRGLVEAGADLTAHTVQILDDVIQIGSVGLLRELLQLLAATPADEARELPGGMEQHVAACCSALANSSDLPGFNRDMVRLLVHAITVTAGVPIHYSTFQKALRETSCAGRSSALEGLLEADPGLECIKSALHYATKTQHGRVVEQLIAAGGEVGTPMRWNALTNSYPQVVRPVVAALHRTGAFSRDSAAEALRRLATRGSSCYGHTEEELTRAATTMRMLVEEFGADPSADSSSCLAVACAQQEPFNRLAELLLLMGATSDAALMSLCSAAPQGGPLAQWQLSRHTNGVEGLLALGTESQQGAAQALTAVLERGMLEPARLLLGTGAVSAAACEALLSRALGVEPEGAGGFGGGAAAGDAEGEQWDAAVAGGGGTAGQQQPQQQEEQQQRRRWDWVWELARAGALQRGAVVKVERALEQACRQGDVEAVRELASLGVVGPERCTAAFWLAFDGGHEACMQSLICLGAASKRVQQEAARGNGA